MPIAFELQQGSPCVFPNLPNLILSHISNMNFQFWAVLGSQGCRDPLKKIMWATTVIAIRFYTSEKKTSHFIV